MNRGRSGGLSAEKTVALNALVSTPWNSTVLLGDSYTAQNMVRVGTYYRDAAVEGYFNLANALAGGRLNVLNFAGVGGNTMAQMLARYDTDVRPYAARWVFVVAGTNDLYVAGRSLAQMIADADGLISTALADGKVMIWSTLWPHAYVNAATLRSHLAFNDWLKTQANARRIYLWDGFSVAVDPTSTQCVPRAGWNHDGGSGNHHPNGVGAYWYGKALAPLIQYLAPPPLAFGGYEDWTTSSGDSNLLDNVTFQGTGGTNTTGGTGTPPTGYTLSKAAGGSCNVSMASVVDPVTGLSLGNYVQLDATFAAASDSFRLESASLVGRGSPQAGAIFNTEATLQVVTPGVLNLCRVGILPDSGASEAAYWGGQEQTAAIWPEATQPMRAKSPDVAVQGAPVSFVWRCTIRGSAAGSGSVRVWLPRVRRVA